MITLLLVLLLAYLIGSIPTSILIGKMARGIDIRKYGSGNAGATNIYRVLGFKLALLVFILDGGKAAATILCLTRLRLDIVPVNAALFHIMTGLALILGNILPIFSGFSGGKGVTTSAGVLMALAPLATVCAMIVWIVVVAVSRYVSLASIAASFTVPAVVLIQKFLLRRPTPFPLIFFTLLFPAIILVAHRSNIQRLLSGTERRLGTRGDRLHPNG